MNVKVALCLSGLIFAFPIFVSGARGGGVAFAGGVVNPTSVPTVANPMASVATTL